MITTEIRRIRGDSENAEVLIVVSSTESDEISSVLVFDRLGEQILFDSIPDCASAYEQRLTVSQRRLPVSARVTRCGTGAEHNFGPFVPPDAGIRPCDPADPTPPSAGCLVALESAQRLRGEISALCITIADLERAIVQQRQVVTAALVIAAALLVAAAIAAFFPPFGTALAIGLAALAGFSALIAIAAGAVVGAYLSQRADANRRLQMAQRDFMNAAAQARRQCCPHEIRISLDTPGC